ncbi:MAG: hypothetical protein NZ522_00145, partial [Chitinophagales bacterium]|nr:hypothetical protein [Chitinophagales bacterium]
FIATATFYLWAYRMFKPGYSHFQFANELIAYMLLGATLSVFLAFIINIFSKVSLHAVGVGNYFALSVLLATVSDINLSLLVVGAVLLAGVVGTARLILRAHALHEVYTGYMIGFTGLYLGFYVFPHSKWLRFL